LTAGTGIPAILRLTEPRKFQIGEIEIECLPVLPPEGEVGGLWLAVDDAAELLALGFEESEATLAAAIDVPHQRTIA
jgi:hypothetical protein